MPLRPDSSHLSRCLAYGLLLFPLALLLPYLGDFLFPPGDASFSDMVISHYPAAVTLKRLILEYGQILLCSPHLLSGAPLAADPLYNLYYPTAWLITGQLNAFESTIGTLHLASLLYSIQQGEFYLHPLNVYTGLGLGFLGLGLAMFLTRGPL